MKQDLQDTTQDITLAGIYKPALLKTESSEEYERLRIAWCNELQPKGFYEHLLVADLIKGEHEKRRLQRVRAQLMAMNRPGAIRNLLALVLDVEASDSIDDLVVRYSRSKAARQTVARILRDFELSEEAIDA